MTPVYAKCHACDGDGLADAGELLAGLRKVVFCRRCGGTSHE